MPAGAYIWNRGKGSEFLVFGEGWGFPTPLRPLLTQVEPLCLVLHLAPPDILSCWELALRCRPGVARTHTLPGFQVGAALERARDPPASC